jgi:hypothetical protein
MRPEIAMASPGSPPTGIESIGLRDAHPISNRPACGWICRRAGSMPGGGASIGSAPKGHRPLPRRLLGRGPRKIPGVLQGLPWVRRALRSEASPITTFNANQFNPITSGFTNPLGVGSFNLSHTGNNLYLNFTPVPEPPTWALMGAGVITLAVAGLRRRRLSGA